MNTSESIATDLLRTMRGFDPERLAKLRSSRTLRTAEDAIMDALAFSPDIASTRVHLAQFLANVEVR